MGYQTVRSGREIRRALGAQVWALAEKQHGVVTRRQLLEIGVHSQAIKHRVASARLHPVRRGVYAVGSPRLTRLGDWMAAVLCCGPRAVLSHEAAGILWRLRRARVKPQIDVSVPTQLRYRRDRVRVHRCSQLPASDVTCCEGIPVTTPVRTLIDLATLLPASEVEAAVNEADKIDLVDPEALRAALGGRTGLRGLAELRELVDARTFVLTDSELERRFLPLARRAGLGPPQTGRYLNGFKVDFHWPELGLIVETDGLRYHRTPAQQAGDRERDQAHTAAGLTPLRFTNAQVRRDPERVVDTLRVVARRLSQR